MMSGTTVGGENPGSGRPGKLGLLGDLKVFQVTEGYMGSTPLSVGIKMALWAIATKKGGKWHWGVFEVADHFMVRWHEEEGEKSWLLYAAENVKSGGKGKGLSLIHI